ncbi:MAG: translocation protein TolB [Pseudomonadota bacterium]|jgi:TolB protein
MIIALRMLSVCLMLFASAMSFAQMRIDVTGAGATRYPVAVANFTAGNRAPQQVADIIRANLTRSGAFRVIDPQATLSDTVAVDLPAMRSRGADAVVTGSVARLADGRIDIRFKLVDTVRETVLAGESLVVPEADVRFGAHRVSDIIYEKLTGDKGIFSTQIAFVSKQGESYRLVIADWDGEGQSSALSSAEPIISPRWSPDGKRLAYVSFESKKPVVYVHTLANGQRLPVANFRGSNSAPAWSPDGKSLAVSLTRDGLSQIYLISADGSGAPTRLTTSSAIDTEPVFTPDGRFIYFTSDRGGSPQIYRVGASGGDVTRITFGSSYNVSPRISPDGATLAYVSRRDGRYMVVVRSIGGGAERVLSDGGQEESPSFSPNGRWLMYATRSGGRDSLMLVTLDGRAKQRLSSNAADIREPTWGPFAP